MRVHSKVLPSEQITLVSFDLFDTLVTRPLNEPIGVFSLIDHSGVPRYRLNLAGLIGFRRWRRWAEAIARRRSTTEEITLRDIYAVLGCVLSNPAEVMRFEVRSELALLRAVPENISTLRGYVAAGKQCCITSDMYLPERLIRRIVRQHAGNFPVHLSSTHGKTKASGELFDVVMKAHGVSPDQVLHIGDNQWADYEVPRRLGLNAKKVPSLATSCRGDSIFECFSHQREYSTDPLSHLGYSVVGPACIAFACHVKHGMDAHGIQKAFFGARDTYLVKRAFNLLFPESSSEYVRLSRRALYIPEITVTGNYDRLFEGGISAEEFFARVDLEVPSALAGLLPSRHKERFLAALGAQGFDRIANEDATSLRAYLESLGFEGKVAYVDLGWRGSLQDSLSRILGDVAEIHGFYFGTTVKHPLKDAYYFSGRRPYRRFLNIFQALPVFEFLFTEPVASLRRIRKTTNGFAFDSVEDETVKQIKSRRAIEVGCERFFSDYLAAHQTIQPTAAAMKHSLDQLIETHLLAPTRETIHAFSEASHSVGFGGSDRINVVDASPGSLRGYIDSTWRAAYVGRFRGPHARLARPLHAIASSRLGAFVIFMLRTLVRLSRSAKHRLSLDTLRAKECSDVR